GLAAMAKGDDDDYGYDDTLAGSYREELKSYAAQPVLGSAASTDSMKSGNGKRDEGPGFFEKLTSTPAYERVKHEAGNVGEALMQEISKTAKTVVLPALMTSFRNFIGGYLPNTGANATQQPSGSANMRSENERGRSGANSPY